MVTDNNCLLSEPETLGKRGIYVTAQIIDIYHIIMTEYYLSTILILRSSN